MQVHRPYEGRAPRQVHKHKGPTEHGFSYHPSYWRMFMLYHTILYHTIAYSTAIYHIIYHIRVRMFMWRFGHSLEGIETRSPTHSLPHAGLAQQLGCRMAVQVPIEWGLRVSM